MFDKIANRYDTINRVLAMNMDIGWRRAMTQRIKELLLLQYEQEQEHEQEQEQHEEYGPWRILDMATGTADVALQLVHDLDSASHPTTVLGLDPSENMLSVGRSKIQTQNLQNKIVLETADARNLQKYHDTTKNDTNLLFDAATMAFGIRNVVPNRSGALCEIHKLLKPNGVLAILEFSDPSYESDGILGAGAGIFIKHVVPFVGGWLSGGARQEYKHLQNSIQEFPAPKAFQQQLQDLECPLQQDTEGNHYFHVGHYDMEDTVHMNFGSVQLYIGRAAIKRKRQKQEHHDTKLPPIGA
jgi:demethylmenaquinone methyltransferase/2-methoxy-6-polyprenyl-1,4-benzoquinol methylase